MNQTVLIVEDDLGLQETLEAILDYEGYTVCIAGDGLEALQKLEAVTPSVILLDLMMPRMDGFAFLEALEVRGLRHAFPIILLTADSRAAQKAEVAGADGFLAKPFTIDALLEAIERLRPA